jgi:fructose-1,6-bisphosphatase I
MSIAILSKGHLHVPGTVDKPNGKLRLQYECNPLVFITAEAGGKAKMARPILDIKPAELHQRTPFLSGARV